MPKEGKRVKDVDRMIVGVQTVVFYDVHEHQTVYIKPQSSTIVNG